MTVRGIRCDHPLEFLSADAVERIHQATLDVLASVGVRFEYEPALKTLQAGGCRVDFDTRVVQFPAQVVQQALTSCLAQFIVRGRTAQFDVEFAPQTVLYATGVGFALIDRLTGERRSATAADLAEMLSLLDTLDNLDLTLDPLPYLADKPQRLNWEHKIAQYVKFARKPGLAPSPMGQIDPKWQILICEAAGRELLGDVTASSPLSYPANAARFIMLMAEKDFPMAVYGGASPGISAPATLAGSLVTQNAEVLAGIVLAQLTRPGCRVLYGSYLLPMDMRSATIVSGGIENSLIYSATAQLARRYRLPSLLFHPTTDSKIPDEQAGYEKGIQWAVLTLSGLNCLGGAGQLENGTLMSYGQLMIDDEIIGMVKRLMQGITVSDETLALDQIRAVGFFPHQYLPTAFTKKWWKGEQYLTKISDRQAHEAWQQRGATEVVARAQARLEQLMKAVELHPLPEAVCRDIDRILEEAEHYESR